MIRESEHPSVWFFGIVSGVCCLIIVLMEVMAFVSFKHGERRIVEHYKSLCSLSESGFQVSASSVDSLASAFDFDVAQRMALQNVARQVLETSIRESLDAVERSGVATAAGSQIYDEVKFLLEEQTEKIEHEYISLEIWCALLTIVFLIFSFFSLMKSDDLVKQGEAGVEALKRMRNEGEKSLSEMKKDGEAEIQSVRETKSTELEKYRSSVSDFITKTRNEAELTRKEMEAISNDIEQFKQTTLGQITEGQQSMRGQFESFITESEKANAALSQRIKDLNGAIFLLEGRLKNISAAIDTKEQS